MWGRSPEVRGRVCEISETPKWGEEPPADAGGLWSYHSVSREELYGLAYGLASQVRKSCAAVPANIAEGCGRDSNADLARFLRMALGSASELQCHLLLSRDPSYLTPRT